ncbi:5'-3' exoribonuclease 1 [Eupeodes corollae]|uniref:5'-3' exoribonuclease 1 n=1 Tax=Eupeodes corollae TaxID=290404 RepID=UPI0024935FF3|nr:5'-3' exoribonuclease 1 [Eupeodes corollae]
MGVPKFFRYISERYPCLSELARENCIPEFDNLYLDMNGIIHNCSHPDDGNIHFNISEEDMFKDICNYIDKLFFLIKPQRLFFMAVDGVAPRAKMNQQRSRRFRSAKDAENLAIQAKNRGETIENTPFDSNCITPGTEFMQRLQNTLRFFVKNKISTDPLWQKCRVILSGHDSPGEGEHKIMDYIRYLKSQKDFDPHTRHCLYGLDADLIILGLCTHEMHFVVLREEVKFGKKTKRASIEETRFFLLHLGLFKEYLELEFSALKQYESFNMAQLIDDWVLMGFLVGNDFIPHLPCLHISSNALPIVYQTYIKIYPKLNGNINEHGILNLRRLEIFLEALSEVEFQLFEENHADLKYFEGKQTKNGIDEAFDFDVNEILENKQDDELAQLIEDSRQFCEGDEMNDITSDDEEQHIVDEFRAYKRNYYIKKLNYPEMTPEVLAEQTITYITALQWILNYYYKGVQSWSWYYPHHYAPFISDLKNFSDFKIEFELGKPFLPFEQLLAVLPAQSRTLLPEAYQDLFVSPQSEIVHFYPKDFETDLNGKKYEWEALVLIPFIDENLLLKAMKKCETDLKPSEVKRNSHGPMLQYDYTTQSQGECQSFNAGKALYNVFCTETPIWRDQININNLKNPLREMENANREVFYPGFPTMKHLQFNFKLKNIRIKVFDFPSRNESMVLMPVPNGDCEDIENVSKKCLGQIVYTGWPHLIKAKVTAVSDSKCVITSEGTTENVARKFEMQCKTVIEHLTSRMGIEIDFPKVLVHVKTLIGTSVTCGSQGRVSNNDVWSQNEIHYPPSVIIYDLKVHTISSMLPKKVENIFPVDSRIFFVGNPYFGSEGTVLDPLLVYECGRLKVSMTVLPDPDLSEPKKLHSEEESHYFSSYDMVSLLGINTRVLMRLTGQLFLVMGEKIKNLSDSAKKVNIGLSMRFPKQNEELAGYCRRRDNSWYFSQKAVTLIQEYNKKFPMVIRYLLQTCSSSNYDFCYESDLFPNKVGEKCVDEIVNWLNEQEFSKAERVPCGTKSVEKEAVEKVIESIEKLKTLPVKTVKLQVKPHLLMKPDINLPEQYKPKSNIRLFDRVVVVRNTYLVPIGSRGTVIGVLPFSDPNPVRLECLKQTSYFLDVLFDKSIPFGNSIYGIADGRVMRVPETAVLCLFSNDNYKNETSDHKSQHNENRIRGGDNAQKPNNNPLSNITSFDVESQAKLKTTIYTENIEETTTKIQPNAVSKEDFWMPAPDTIKRNYIKSVAEQSTIDKSYPNHVNNWRTAHLPIDDVQQIKNDNWRSTSLSTNDHNAGTDVLKNLHETHKWRSTNLPTNPAQNGLIFANQESNLNSGTEALKNMLGLATTNSNKPIVNASQFPPPPNWRNSTMVANKSDEALQMSNPATDIKKNDVPLQYYGKCFPHFAPQQQLPYVNDNFYSPVCLNQKGAFIPLQVLKSCPNKVLQESVVVEEEVEQSMRKLNIDASNNTKGNYKQKKTTIPLTDSNKLIDALQETATKKTPKTSKIAARFDNL